jgi:hypothetical protein
VVKPQVDVQRRWASLRLRPWRWHRDLAWPACSATLLGVAASGIAFRSTATPSTPSVALACRWRPLDLARARGDEVAPRVMSKLSQCVFLHIVELTERGARTAPVGLILSHLAEEDKTRPLQGLGDPDGVDDAVEWCAQVRHGDIRGVLLWEQSVLLLWKKAFRRRALGTR